MADQSNPTAASAEAAAISAVVAEQRGWFIALGILLTILGIVAIGAPVVTTIVAKVFFGWLFLVAGIAEIIHAFYARDWKGFFANLLIGLLYAGVGGWMAFFPLAGIVGLTLLIAILFIVEGIFKFILSLQVRPQDGWFWVLLSGIAAIAVGVLIFMELPSSAAWAIGLLVGINLLLSGLAFLMMSLFAR